MLATIDVAVLKDQDPWQSRGAWAGVRDALERGNFRDIVTEKTKVKWTQREMRAREEKMGKTDRTAVSKQQGAGSRGFPSACQGNELAPVRRRSERHVED